MEKLNYDYSFKNIPTPDNTTYRIHLIEKVESVIKRMRWKAQFFLDETWKNTHIESNTYGFKTRNYPKQCTELEEFEKDLLNMVKLIQFKNSTDAFQTKIKSDIATIKESPNVFIFADKTNNVYEMTPTDHEKLLADNITKTYKKAPQKLEKSINLEAKSIAESYKLSDRIDCIAKTPAYITLKDHKENFDNNPSCRLINPSKNELGKISKSILERVNKQLMNELNVNQWKNTSDVITWFKNLTQKHKCKFIQLDIKEFYPSISQETLEDALSFARKHATLTAEEIRIVTHCRKSLLFNKDQTWKKKDTESCFDVTMGSYDGAEVCELVGTHILSSVKEKIKNIEMGLYRDDGLIALKKTNGPQIDRTRKNLIEIFKSFGFGIDIVVNLTQVNFLDVTFDLKKSSYQPYKKPNDNLYYINILSNHPPNIIKQLPVSIADRLSQNSSSERIFNKAKTEYENALRKCGYQTELKFKSPQERLNNNKTQRRRKIIWFNPPFSKNVKTNVAKRFLNLIDKHFPTNHKLHKIFNRNNVKVSYSCTSNICKIIKGHNNNLISKDDTTLECNCRVKTNCPVQGKCRTTNAIYKCLVQADDTPDKVYIGLAEDWKTRYRNHVKSLKHEKYSHETSLSTYVWELKANGKTPSLTWSIVKSVPSYSNISKKCLLCLYEKLAIITYESPDDLLNKRSELISKCRHENKYLLKNYKNR